LAYRTAREGLDIVRRLGMRGYAYYMIGNASELAIRMGDWDWALAELAEALAASENDNAARMRRAEILGLRGHDVEADFTRLTEVVQEMTELQAQASVAEVIAMTALAQGDASRALDLAQQSYRLNVAPDATAPQTAMRAAAWLGDSNGVSDALAVLEGHPGRVSAAIRHEGQAALAALGGHRREATAGFIDAGRRWRELSFVFDAALAELNMVTLLGASEPETRAAAESAEATFTRLEAEPLLRLLQGAVAGAPPERFTRVNLASPDRTAIAADQS